jgi:YegS/Rv2252/BmrU family lipid kinase
MKAVVIRNPVAGRSRIGGVLGPDDGPEQLRRALDILSANGWTVRQQATLGRGDATSHARQAVADRADAVIVAGGDGSINEVVQALAHSGTALAVLPCGTGNVWAREVGLPLHNLPAAARAIVHGTVRTVDLGLAGDRYFLMWAGIGFDASLVKDMEELEPELKRRWGMAAFVLRGAAVAMSFMGSRLNYRIDGRRIRRRTIMAILSNGSLYAAYLRLAPGARLDDGLLDFYIFKGRDVLATARHFAGLVAGQHVRDPEVEYYTVQRMGVGGRRAMPVHTDGEYAGQTPMEFRVAPGALHVIVP